ncbi:MAG: hypothetical protein ACKO2B_04695, partial [Betaproteobacteria bacterium]
MILNFWWQQTAGSAVALTLAFHLSIGQAQADRLTQDRPEAGRASAATGSLPSPQVFQHHIVSAANPYASRAGLEILRAGGSAVDAAITIQLVLNLV